jgi:hypothetical protein
MATANTDGVNFAFWNAVLNYELGGLEKCFRLQYAVNGCTLHSFMPLVY